MKREYTSVHAVDMFVHLTKLGSSFVEETKKPVRRRLHWPSSEDTDEKIFVSLIPSASARCDVKSVPENVTRQRKVRVMESAGKIELQMVSQIKARTVCGGRFFNLL